MRKNNKSSVRRSGSTPEFRFRESKKGTKIARSIRGQCSRDPLPPEERRKVLAEGLEIINKG